MGLRKDRENPFQSMPNFRELDFAVDSVSVKNTRKLYRSSRPDFLTQEEAEYFTEELGVKCIIDLRSAGEYSRANGTKLLNDNYPLYKLKLPFKLQKPVEKFELSRIKNGCQGHGERKHILMDFFKMNYVAAVYKRGPWYLKLYSLLFLLLDLIMLTHFTNFVRVYARNVLNKSGLRGQYIDMLTFSQAQLCSALKILSKPENVPALINCAHGKDRTGLLSALVLGCMGKSKEFIANDYSRSETGLAPIMSRVYKEIVTKFHMCESFTTAKAETMMDVLDYIDDAYGSMENYLESIGFGAEDQDALRRNLTS